MGSSGYTGLGLVSLLQLQLVQTHSDGGSCKGGRRDFAYHHVVDELALLLESCSV